MSSTVDVNALVTGTEFFFQFTLSYKEDLRNPVCHLEQIDIVLISMLIIHQDCFGIQSLATERTVKQNRYCGHIS